MSEPSMPEDAGQTAILDSLPAHVAVIDGAGVIRAVNEAWRRFAVHNAIQGGGFGVGTSYVEACDKAEGPCSEEARAAAKGIRQVLEGTANSFHLDYPCHSPEAMRWFRMKVVPLNGRPSAGAVVMHVEVTDRMETERRLLHLNRLHAVLTRINEAITRVREPEALYAEVCRIAVDEGLMRMAWAGVVEPGTRRIRSVAQAGHDAGYIFLAQVPVDDATLARGPLAVALREGRCDRCNDIARDPRMAPWRDAALARGYRSVVSVPVVSGDTVVAAFAFYAEEAGFFREPEMQLMEAVAEDLAFALASIRAAAEARAAERALRESEERYRLLFERNPHPMWVFDLETLRFLAVNTAAIRQYGYSEAEFLEMTIRDIRPESEWARLDRDIAEAATVRSTSGCWLHRRRDGSLCEVEISADAIVFGGRAARLVLANDITERRKAERFLAGQSDLGRRLNSAATAQEAAEIIADVAERLIGWDAATLDLCSAEHDDVQVLLTVDTIDGRKVDCRPAYNHSPPSPLARRTIEEGALLILRDDENAPKEAAIPFGDTSRRSASLMFVPVRDGLRVVGVLSIQSYRPRAYDRRDLETLQGLADYCGGAMHRIQAAVALRESEERYRILWETTTDAVLLMDETGMISYANPALAEVLGYDPEEVVGRNISMLQPERLREAHARGIARYLATGAKKLDWRATEAVAVHRDGREIPVEVSFSHVAIDGKHLFSGFLRDISDRKQAEERLAQQAALIDQVPNAIQVRSLDHRIEFWSRGAERLYGWTSAEASGQRFDGLLRVEGPKVREAERIVLQHGAWAGELQQSTRAGVVLTLDCRWALLRDPDGRPKSILSIDTDVTERKRIEAQFLRAQRMESIGTLAGGIAHDLNNVLAPILMSVEMLREKARDQEEAELLLTVESSAQRGASLIRQVLTFARGIEGARVPVTLGHLLREIQNIVRDTFPKSIDIRLGQEANLWAVTGDPTQLHQVFLNLCVNARDAMPNGGALTVSAENTVLDEVYAGMNPDSKVGAYVCVKVTDTGVGIPPGIRDRIFEPFFTTKEFGKGTGLGLSTTLAIVKSHGGFINLYSEAGLGTTFKVYLPANTTMTSAENTAVEQTQLPRGHGELVLVVDDEEGIRKVAQKTLERFGYRVVLAEHGAEAVSVYAVRRDEIAVVLTDMAMPIMDGPALIVALKTLNPAVRIIASSGLNANGGVAKAVGAGVNHFVPKPYTAEVMLKTLASLLGT